MTAGLYLTVDAEPDQIIALISENGDARPCQAITPPVIPPPPVAPTVVRGSVVFNMVNGLQRLTLAVPGIQPNDPAWVTLGGDTDPPGELAGVQGCFCSTPDEVTILAYYPGATSSVTVPVIVFWQPQ